MNHIQSKFYVIMEYTLHLFSGKLYTISKSVTSQTILSETTITNQTALAHQTHNPTVSVEMTMDEQTESSLESPLQLYLFCYRRMYSGPEWQMTCISNVCCNINYTKWKKSSCFSHETSPFCTLIFVQRTGSHAHKCVHSRCVC